MNYWLIAGTIFSSLAAVLLVIGTVVQQKKDSKRNTEQTQFQKSTLIQLETITEASTNTLDSSKRVEQSVRNVIAPEVLITGINIDWKNMVYRFQIENAGNATADAVDLLLDYSLPAGHGNGIRIKQLTKGKKTSIPHDIFPNYSLFQAPGAEGKKEYDQCISGFREGKRTLIVRIALTYHWGDGNSETEKYTLVHSHDGASLSKDTSDIPYPVIDEG